MKTTNRKLNTFLTVANNYLATNKDETKLKYALTRVSEKGKNILKDYSEKVEDLKIDLASVDDKKNLIQEFNPTSGEATGYKYTPENMKKLRKDIEVLFDAEIEIEAHLVKELPDNFDEGYKEYFDGFVL